MRSKALGSLLLFPQLGSDRGPAVCRSVWNWIFSLMDSAGFAPYFFLPYSVVKRWLRMRRQMWLACVLVTLLWAPPAKADTGVIVRTTNLPALQALCVLPITCTVVRGVDGTLGQVFLVTTPLPLDGLLNLLNGVTGFVEEEVDQVLSLIGGLYLGHST